MRRGAWLIGWGLVTALAAFYAPGCSSSSSGGNTTGDSGGDTSDTGAVDTTAGDASDATTGDATDSSTGAEAGDGADAASCPAASQFFPNVPARAQCAGDHCCAELTACQGSSECVAIFGCVVACFAASDGGTGALGMCAALCEADASAMGMMVFNQASQCVVVNCGSLFVADAGTD